MPTLDAERLREIRECAASESKGYAWCIDALRDLLAHVEALEASIDEYEKALAEEQDRYTRDVLNPPVLTEPETLRTRSDRAVGPYRHADDPSQPPVFYGASASAAERLARLALVVERVDVPCCDNAVLDVAVAAHGSVIEALHAEARRVLGEKP